MRIVVRWNFKLPPKKSKDKICLCHISIDGKLSHSHLIFTFGLVTMCSKSTFSVWTSSGRGAMEFHTFADCGRERSPILRRLLVRRWRHLVDKRAQCSFFLGGGHKLPHVHNKAAIKGPIYVIRHSFEYNTKCKFRVSKKNNKIK